jgi:hypothetical protein
MLYFYIKCDPSWSIQMPYMNTTYLHIHLTMPTYLIDILTRSYANNTCSKLDCISLMLWIPPTIFWED